MSNWMTRDEAAATLDRCTASVEHYRKRGMLRARKEPRCIEAWNGHAYIAYEKMVWVYDPASVQELRRKGGRR